MMPLSRLALVADDGRLASQIQGHLKATLGREIAHAGTEAIRGQLTRAGGGLLLLAAGSVVESERALRLVQEIALQRLPCSLVLLEAGAPGPGRGLGALAPYLMHRLRWPDEATRITALLRDRVNGAAAGEESVEEVIARRLLVQTPSLVALVERIVLAARYDVTVLLTGETGTGKTHLARLMHDCSPRAREPFLVVPCGAVPAALMESTFFGHARGAFTGAVDHKVGKFEAAGGGTLLLDEIDALPLEHQAGLLRVIETGEFEPVGCNETRQCRARLIVASNWDLEDAVRRGRFREDLYYRLNVMSFHLPPLRERIEDVAPLARAMAARFTTRFRKDLFDIHALAVDALEAYPWPGNIRQLDNVVQQAVLVSSGPELLLEHLPGQVRAPRPAAATSPSAAGTLKHNRESLERNVIVRALAEHDHCRSRAAVALGISRVTLYKKMKKYGLLEAH
jgi:transcriptional regulator with PAS, ATPase and Fis domain